MQWLRMGDGSRFAAKMGDGRWEMGANFYLPSPNSRRNAAYSVANGLPVKKHST
jgi:hypothetical protein